MTTAARKKDAGAHPSRSEVAAPGPSRTGGVDDDTPDRPVVVLGLLHAGLAIARTLGRHGVEVHGMTLHESDFGITSKYVRSGHVFPQEPGPERTAQMLATLERIAAGRRLVLIPERDDSVGWVLDNWEAVTAIADVPLPPDPDTTLSLRRKERLIEVAARAGVPAPATVLADCEETIEGAGLRPPFLLKPAEGQDYALTFGEKVVVAESVADACEAWRRADEAGFDMLVQEYVPESHEKVYSLLAYLSVATGEPLAAVSGRKVRQGPLRFGTSAFFETDHQPRVVEKGLRLLAEAGYRGFAHVEMVYDGRDDAFKLIEVNTRPPVWIGIAINDDFDIAKVAYDDLCGRPPLICQLDRKRRSWVYLAKDVYVSAQMAKRRELRVGEVAGHYLRRHKTRAVFAADDLAPAWASLRYLRSRV
jgi:D-aspartate ligase